MLLLSLSQKKLLIRSSCLPAEGRASTPGEPCPHRTLLLQAQHSSMLFRHSHTCSDMQPPKIDMGMMQWPRSAVPGMLQDNLLHGRFLAELTHEVLTDLAASKYQHAEYRISIYGRKAVEWDILAAWICQHNLDSDNVLWLIQVGRFE